MSDFSLTPTQPLSDLIFVRFKAEFRFFYSGFYCYDSFFIVYSILPIADFRFFVVLKKSGLHYSAISWSVLDIAKLLFIFYTGEAVNNAAGLGFNGYDSNGEPKWDLLNNANIFELEVEYRYRLLEIISSGQVLSYSYLCKPFDIVKSKFKL